MLIIGLFHCPDRTHEFQAVDIQKSDPQRRDRFAVNRQLEPQIVAKRPVVGKKPLAAAQFDAAILRVHLNNNGIEPRVIDQQRPIWAK